MTEQRRNKEITKWERIQGRRRSRGYILYIVFIITLIYTIDEIASQIGMLMKTEIANDLFARFGNSSVGALEILGAIGLPFQIMGLAYRPLADRYGRKLFLVVNTLGMSVALLLIYLSRSIPLYFVGACLVQFFIPHDMHVVYIMETAPPKHRAKIYSTIKFTATLGVMLIPMLRGWLMENVSQWRRVYLLPAILGLVTVVIALVLAKETDTFVEARLAALRAPEADGAEKKRAEWGLFKALKYAMRDKQLRWLYIAAALTNIGFLGTINYQVIMSYGFAWGLYGSYSEAAMNAVAVGAVTNALVLFPLGCACAQLITGFVSDRFGRKASAILSAAGCVAAFLGFFFGARCGLAPYAVGVLCGVCIGSYYALNDVIIMMVGESAPTGIRSSVMSAQFIVTLAGGLVSYAVGLPLLTILGNKAMGGVSFGLLVPGFLLALIVLARNTRDTRGRHLDSV